MEPDRESREPDETLKPRRRWYLFALALLVLSLLARQPVVFLAAVLTLLLGLVPDLWYRRALRHLVVRQSVSQRRCFAGEDVLLSLSIENQKWLPLPWLLVEHAIVPPLARLSRDSTRLQAVPREVRESAWLLWSFQRVTRQYRLRCQERGFHTFGPVKLTSSDPFGWLECERTVPAGETLLVYPLLAPLESLGYSALHPLGKDVRRPPFLEDPSRFAGVRDYAVGDEPRRIHWKATAHAGVLKSKRYDPPALRRLLLLLDVWNYSQAFKGADRDLQEWTIAAAASLAVWALEEGYLVGFRANCPLVPVSDYGSEPVEIPFAADPQQAERLLAACARLKPESSVPLGSMLEHQAELEALGTAVLLVSVASALTERTIGHLLDFQRRGAAVHLALTGDPVQSMVPETTALSVHHLGGKEIWYALLSTSGDQGGDGGERANALHLD